MKLACEYHLHEINYIQLVEDETLLIIIVFVFLRTWPFSQQWINVIIVFFYLGQCQNVKRKGKETFLLKINSDPEMEVQNCIIANAYKMYPSLWAVKKSEILMTPWKLDLVSFQVENRAFKYGVNYFGHLQLYSFAHDKFDRIYLKKQFFVEA